MKDKVKFQKKLYLAVCALLLWTVVVLFSSGALIDGYARHWTGNNENIVRGE